MRLLFLIVFLSLCLSSFAQSLKVLTYNIHHGNPPGKPGKIDLSAIAKVINDADADLVGIQEVDVNLSRSEMVDQAGKLAEMTKSNYYFSKGIDLENGEYGTLILTKHRIISQRRYDLPMPVKSENRSLAIVDVELPDGKVVSFANTHLDLKEENRIAQVKYINELGVRYTRPLILVGDMNARPDQTPMQLLQTHFVRNTNTNEPTSPNVNPKNEIDYILVGKHSKFKWIKYEVVSEKHASDHLPLFAEIEIE
ncbi:endonuclease/exonuclease/phosphatase family protein [Sphingobacterium pedocola]|uniref:Endonuclease n=1 Tax=Sphingobacterium pedocola TaxID=2082722 RepID=A0ABR9TA38_9SPHI|nr:endonuclease/exonuclease/phosphatase family protein [Sphingobacterium pedocola]MBE8722204.1 endonuclease [Sphingobacterium pedocola]